ncbi:MAG: S1 RNA-binding domain-containing protein, partial [Proteobacteria bacterium]|nr:S1 RNA-binding domain-containing protein [Pseudomonadota bacterium]
HVTDISWKRINHPTETLSIGQQINVQVIRFNPETQRISLGMKQLEADPWEGVSIKYPVGTKFTGRVTNITDYGAFVELEAGVEGLVHVSEMSWTKKNVHPGKIVSTSQQVEVMVLDADEQKRRISLGLKQCGPNPWDDFVESYAPGAEIEGDIKNITEFGLFVGLPGGIDGMVHFSDLDWQLPGEEAVKSYKKGDTIKVKVLDVDVTKERISLGIKQLGEDPFASAMKEIKKGAVVTGTVHQVLDAGIEVKLAGNAIGFIRKIELSRERSEQRPDRFAVGEKVDAKITAIDNKSRKISLSIKQREAEEEKKAMADYGSTESGASLGEILGAAISRAAEEKEPVADDEEKPKAKKKAAKEEKAEEPEAEDAEEPEAEDAEEPEAEDAEEPEAEDAGNRGRRRGTRGQGRRGTGGKASQAQGGQGQGNEEESRDGEKDRKVEQSQARGRRQERGERDRRGLTLRPLTADDGTARRPRPGPLFSPARRRAWCGAKCVFVLNGLPLTTPRESGTLVVRYRARTMMSLVRTRVGEAVGPHFPLDRNRSSLRFETRRGQVFLRGRGGP